MRIRTFCKYLDQEEVKNHSLKDCTVVVDGQNFFYNLYQKSGLPSLYGCEGDKYANYLRKYLGMFKMANIQCYFIFKGGHMDINYKLKKMAEQNWNKNDTTDHYFVQPVFLKELYKQVLDEMDFNYAICEYEAKAEVIAFAKKYNCPVLSFDIEYCFSGIPYIPYSTISGCNSEGVICGLFNLCDFLEKFKINNKKLAIFIALTDEQIFGEGFFMALFKSLNMPTSAYKRNISLLKWLGRLSEQSTLDIIYKYAKEAEFEEKLQDAYKFIQRHKTTGIPTKFMQSKIEFTERDPDWFSKGVTMGRIAINYVNLYRNNIYFGAWTIEDENADDSLLCSLDIIIYAFNLLTNFEKKEFVFHDKNDNKRTISSTKASYGVVQKPNYNAFTSPFENGWDQVKNLRLFEQFLEESLQGFDHAVLQQAPDDVRLLIVALVYFSRQKTIDPTNIRVVCSILLSYVMLGVVFEKLPLNDCGVVEITMKPYLDSTTQKESVNEIDCVIANNILQKYFQLSISESHKIFKESLIHPFVEFQHCLVQLNNLNNLCGASYKPTEYSKTFNGTFAYKLLVAAEADGAGNGLEFTKKLLNPAATVLSLFNGLFELYEHIISL